jgi:transposase-like protein
LLRGTPLGKDAISRLVGRLRADFATWSQRELAADQIRYLFLDGWYPRVRIGKKRVRVPVLVTLGTCADGRRVLLDLRLEEFRRRTKTQASLPSEDAVLLLLFGLIRSGQITLRRMVGWQDMSPAVLAPGCKSFHFPARWCRGASTRSTRRSKSSTT